MGPGDTVYTSERISDGRAGTRVLLIEDNPGDARLVSLHLDEVRPTEVDIRLEQCASLGEARQLVGSCLYDSILLDLGLPDSTGLATLEAVRETCPDSPVIVLTGLDDMDVALSALKAGAADFLTKGAISGELLVRAIRYAIERTKADQQIRTLLERQTQINQVTLELGKTLDMRETYRTIYRHVGRLVDADAFIVSLYDDEAKLLTAGFVVTRGEERDVSAFPPIPLEDEGRGTQSRVIRTGKALIVPDWQEAMRRTDAHYRIHGDGSVSEGSAEPDENSDSDVTRSALLAPMRVESRIVGVLHVQSHRYDAYTDADAELLSGLGNVAGAAICNAQLVQKIEDDAKQLRLALAGTVNALSQLSETRDPYTAGHQRRVAALACAIGWRMGLDSEAMEFLRIAGLLHDIGKMSVPAEILVKPSSLTSAEYSLLKAHPEVGFTILESADVPGKVAAIVLQHHERLDGSGYPNGIRGDAVVLEARILGVADVVEAMSSHRPYRAALGIDAALREVTSGVGSVYDADVVAACVAVFADGFAWEGVGG
jgi:putative nucleotidyltransferase with HDIG domain